MERLLDFNIRNIPLRINFESGNAFAFEAFIRDGYGQSYAGHCTENINLIAQIEWRTINSCVLKYRICFDIEFIHSLYCIRQVGHRFAPKIISEIKLSPLIVKTPFACPLPVFVRTFH